MQLNFREVRVSKHQTSSAEYLIHTKYLAYSIYVGFFSYWIFEMADCSIETQDSIGRYDRRQAFFMPTNIFNHTAPVSRTISTD